jgi:cytochrome c5
MTMQEHGKHDSHPHDPHGHHPHAHDHGHHSIRHWLGPVIATGVALIATIVVLVLLTQIVTDVPSPARDDDAAVLSRIKPIGELQLASASGPKGQLTGEEVYGQVCKTCHEGGLAGAPKVGDKAAWSKLIAQGLSTTVEHAVKGVRAMPPKGGNPDLEPSEVERAVVFMANKAGANWKEAPAPAGTKGVERTGEQVVQAACGKCHVTGEGGAPKIGDRAAWTPRAAKGLATVTQAALKGHGGMPARGGMADLSDAEVKNAIEYMINTSIGKAAATATAAAAATPPTAASAAGKPDGKKIFETTCTVCHGTGVAGAPKFGDKAAWKMHLAHGPEHLYQNAIKGMGAMPPKGGNSALSDADVKAAVDYMIAAVK